MTHARVVTAFLLSIIAAAAAAPAQAQGRGRGRGEQPQPRTVSPAEQQQRAHEEEQRATSFKQHMDEQMRAEQQRTAQLQQQRRAAELREQQDYEARLRAQEQRVPVRSVYTNDPYVVAAPTYRYRIAGTVRETNDYGVNALRQALNYGYQEGVRAGIADRQDRWRSDYQASPAYQDADYGYTGQYIDLPDYSYYFRQGFQRGYDDGYSGRFRYGTQANGTYSILGSLLTSLLGLQRIP